MTAVNRHFSLFPVFSAICHQPARRCRLKPAGVPGVHVKCSLPSAESLTAESWHKLLHYQFRDRPAVGAQEQSLAGAVAQDRHSQAFATGAAGGGFAGLRLFRADGGLLIKAPCLLRVQFEGAAAVGANVIEAALGLAGVNNVAAAALRAANDLLERGQGHEGILASSCQLSALSFQR